MRTSFRRSFLPAALLLSGPLAACSVERSEDGTALVRRGDDVLASGSEIRLADSVTGDLMVSAGDVQFAGATGGDYLGAAGNQVIGGRIAGDMRAAGGNVVVESLIERNATIAGGNIVLDESAAVERSAYLAGGTVRVDGRVGSALSATGGSVVLNGRVGGDVVVTAGELRVGPGAEIAGALRYSVPVDEVTIDPAARITGEVVVLPVRDWRRTWMLLRVLWALGFLVAGAVAVALFPRLAAAAADAVSEHPGMAALAGIMWLVLVPVAAAIVAVTLVGIPLAVIALLVWLVLAYLGRAVVALWLGRRILGEHAGEERAGALLGFLVGAIILLLISGVVPVLGRLVLLAATIVGLGALLVCWRHPRAAVAN